MARMSKFAAVSSTPRGRKSFLVSIVLRQQAMPPVNTFAAGFLYGIDRRKSLEEAGSYASIAASAIIAKFGGQFNKAEIEELKKKLD